MPGSDKPAKKQMKATYYIELVKDSQLSNENVRMTSFDIPGGAKHWRAVAIPANDRRAKRAAVMELIGEAYWEQNANQNKPPRVVLGAGLDDIFFEIEKQKFAGEKTNEK